MRENSWLFAKAVEVGIVHRFRARGNVRHNLQRDGVVLHGCETNWTDFLETDQGCTENRRGQRREDGREVGVESGRGPMLLECDIADRFGLVVGLRGTGRESGKAEGKDPVGSHIDSCRVGFC